jgi:osmotically-inducible protein OsmY
MRTDLELTSDVSAELKADPQVHEKEIGVAVASAVVTLAGTVPSYADKFAAERAAERVTGVRALADELTVKLPSMNERSDTDIAVAAANALRWDTEVPDQKIKVKVVHGWLTLEGAVEWYYQKAAAKRDVRYLIGVKGVTNLVSIEPRVSAGLVQRNIEAAIKRSAEVDSKKVMVQAVGGKVTLSGTVRSWAERAEAERAAWSTVGVTDVDDKIAVSLMA